MKPACWPRTIKIKTLLRQLSRRVTGRDKGGEIQLSLALSFALSLAFSFSRARTLSLALSLILRALFLSRRIAKSWQCSQTYSLEATIEYIMGVFACLTSAAIESYIARSQTAIVSARLSYCLRLHV